MKPIVTLVVLPLLFCSSCITDVDRHTLHVYYVKNKSASSIQLVGVQSSQSNETDTVFNQDVASQDSILLKKVSFGFSGPYFDPFQLDSCDTVFIMKGNIVYNRSINTDRHLQPQDSASVLFQFSNTDVWKEFSRIAYEDDEQQTKEIYFEFIVN